MQAIALFHFNTKKDIYRIIISYLFLLFYSYIIGKQLKHIFYPTSFSKLVKWYLNYNYPFKNNNKSKFNIYEKLDDIITKRMEQNNKALRKETIDMKLKKQISLLLATLLITTAFTEVFSYPVSAQAMTKNNITKQQKASQEKDELTEITKKVKEKLTIPSNLTEFEYYMQEEDVNNRIWMLVWQDKQGIQNLRIGADSKGRIISYRLYEEKTGMYVPKFQKNVLKEKAELFIKQASPELEGKISYLKGTFEGTYSGCYFYHYERKENGILMPDNQIQVAVNYETGQVVEYHVDWGYNLTIPNKETSVTKEEAYNKIRKELKMNLSYRTVSDEETGKKKAYLIYTPTFPYLSVDAKNGTLYTNKNENSSSTSKEREAGNAKEDSANGLSQVEINEIDKIKDIITKQQAIKTVKENKRLLLDPKLTNISASLAKRNGQYNDYVWNVEFNHSDALNEKGSDSYGKYAFATVDAKTGTILSYYTTINNRQNNGSSVKVSSLKYSKEDCQKIFEAFAKEQFPSYMKETVKGEIKNDYILTYKNNKPIYGGYQYQYNRAYKNIPYENNYINGFVDLVTGKIYEFYHDWHDSVTFEEPDNILTEEQAFQSYMEKDGFELVYEIHTTNDESKNISKENVRLVYNTNINPAIISPFTGKQLNYDGSTYIKNTDQFNYKDINGHEAARSIALLADMGIGFEGNQYKPEQAITQKELYTFLEKLYLNDKIIKQELEENSNPITRVEAAYLAIKILNLNKIAAMDIYQINFADKDSIKKEDVGYVALVNGLGILKTDKENYFHPKEKLTRGQAADFMIGILSVS